MSLVTDAIITFYHIKDLDVLKKTINSSLIKLEEYCRIEELRGHVHNAGTKSGDMYVIAGGFNYWSPAEIRSFCESVVKCAKVSCVVSTLYQYDDGVWQTDYYDTVWETGGLLK